MKKKTGPVSNGKETLSSRLSRFITKYALGIVVFFVLATAGLIPVASKLQLHANFLDLLPPTHPSIVNLKELMNHVGGTSFLIAILESPDEKTSMDAANLFSQRAAHFRQVEYVDNRTNVPEFANRKLLFLNLESVKRLKQMVQDTIDYNRRKNSPFSLDLLEEAPPSMDPSKLELEEKVSKIGGFSAKEQNSYMQVVLLKPKHPVSDFTNTAQLFDEVHQNFSDVQKQLQKPVTLGLTGPYRTRYEEYRTIVRDLKNTGIIATVLLVLINIFAFRNIRSLIYAYLPLAMGTIWIWAFTQMSIGYLNLITAFLAAILFGMGGDYTFHILVSFEEDLQQTGGDPLKAIQMTFSELWHPLWSSMWTTAVVFYAMMISQFEGFRHFGIIAGVGIVISFLIVLFFQPALILLGEKYFPKKRKASKGIDIPKPAIYTIIVVGILFSIYSFSQIKHATFDYDFKDLQAKDDDSIELAEKIGGHFGVHLTPVVLMTPNRQTAAKLAEDINQYIEKNPKSLFDFAAAITSHVPKKQQEKIEVLGEIETVIEKYRPILKKLDEETQNKIRDLEKQLKPTPFVLEDLPSGLQEQYEGAKHEISTVFIYPAQRIFNGVVAKRFVKEARDFPAPPGVKVAGEPLIYADILSLMERDTPIALAISTVVVFFLVFLHFKRLDHTLWVHAPLVIGGLWLIGMMGLSGLQFNFFNMVIIPSILGVGIDNGIYIFDRYRERKRENFFETMKKSLKGVVLSSATNLSGFASIMFASHLGMASMGKLGFFGFLSCLLSSVFFIPAVIEFFELHYAHLFKRSNPRPKN